MAFMSWMHTTLVICSDVAIYVYKIMLAESIAPHKSDGQSVAFVYHSACLTQELDDMNIYLLIAKD